METAMETERKVGTLRRETAQTWEGETIFTIAARCGDCGGGGRATETAPTGKPAKGNAKGGAGPCESCEGSGWMAEQVPATRNRDVTLPIGEIAADGLTYDRYPDCPDCGASGEPALTAAGAETNGIAWAEAGGVPGTRRCMTCGSLFADLRYSVACLPEETEGGAFETKEW